MDDERARQPRDPRASLPHGLAVHIGGFHSILRPSRRLNVATMDNLAGFAQHLLTFAPDALILVDVQGRIIFANVTTTAIFGYTNEQLVGRPIEMLVPERFRLRHGAHVASFLKDPANREMGARLIDLFARKSDGSEFPAGIRLAPFYTGGKAYIAAAIRDMTERRAINEALIAAREEADRANHAKSRFLATASHDLRQPLQAIRLLNASIMNLIQGNSEVGALLRTQEQAIDGANRMLNALLDITRLESGAIKPELAPVALNAIFSDLHREFQPLASAKRLVFAIPETATAINTDRILFTQLLRNVIGNSLKYTAAGSVRVNLNTEADALTIDVVDTGIGIPEDKLDRVFDEYYQVDTQGSKRSGVGLGLAIVREVSRLLGYSVAVTSRVGSGTQVRIRIPVQRLAAPSPAAPREAPAAASTAPKRNRLLLIEDNDSVRGATELFLTLEGYEILSAGTIEEAEMLLAGLRQDDVLISDYHLDAKLTGLDVLQELRTRHARDVPAILLTGDLASMLRAVKTPIPRCRFLSKPVDTGALLAAIQELTAG